MSDIQFSTPPPYLEFWAHSTYLPDCWHQVKAQSGWKSHPTREDGYRSINTVQSAYFPPTFNHSSYRNKPLFVSNNIDRLEKKYGDFKSHILPYTATNTGLSGFKSRGFSIVDENESYMAELLSNNKNVRVVNSANLDRLNDALTTKSEIDLGKMYAGAMVEAKGKIEVNKDVDISELNPLCHIDAESHHAVQSPVPHTSDTSYPLGYDILNNNQAFKMGPILEGGDYFSLAQQAGMGGIILPRDPSTPASVENPLPYSYDYIKQNVNNKVGSRYTVVPWTPVRSARVLNGKKAFIFGDDMYRTIAPPRDSYKTSFTCIVVAKPTAVDYGKIFSAVLRDQRCLVHLPWQDEGAGYFDWARPEKAGVGRLTFITDMINPAVYTFTANNKLKTATVRINGVTVNSTNNASTHNLNQAFAINGNYAVNGQRWWNPCFLGEMIFTGANIMFDNWLPYEKYLMKKWRINHE
jgi:hypothetical protein